MPKSKALLLFLFVFCVIFVPALCAAIPSKEDADAFEDHIQQETIAFEQQLKSLPPTPRNAKIQAFQEKVKAERLAFADSIQGQDPEVQTQLINNFQVNLQAEQKQFQNDLLTTDPGDRQKAVDELKQKNNDRFKQYSQDIQNASNDQRDALIQNYLADKRAYQAQFNEKMKASDVGSMRQEFRKKVVAERKAFYEGSS